MSRKLLANRCNLQLVISLKSLSLSSTVSNASASGGLPKRPLSPWIRCRGRVNTLVHVSLLKFLWSGVGKIYYHILSLLPHLLEKARKLGRETISELPFALKTAVTMLGNKEIWKISWCLSGALSILGQLVCLSCVYRGMFLKTFS